MIKEKTHKKYGKINRGMCHIIENAHGGIYELSSDMSVVSVTIQQIEVVPVDNLYSKKTVKTATITGSSDIIFSKQFYRGMCVPGNIVYIQQIDPIDPDDPEAGLLWENGRVVRHNGKAVYQYPYYDSAMSYKDTGNIDYLLSTDEGKTSFT
jgi:hypothetical protein